VVAEERRLPPPGRPAGEDPPAEELDDRDGTRRHAPQDERPDDELEIRAAPDEYDEGRREQRVLRELPRRHEVGVPVVRLVEGERIDDRGEVPDEEGDGGDPHPAPGCKRRPVADPDPERDGGDREHREVGEDHVYARRPGVEREPRLEAHMQEEDRQRGSEDERAR
jgi:hypothetical protein